MNRRRIVKIAAVLIGVPLLLVTIALLYLNFADLSGWRDTVAELASDAIGRELRISGEFQPEIGFTTRVVATDITLANADWSTDPHMVSAERLVGEIDLLSIFFGPITIGDVEVSGAQVLFETSTEGHFNWALGDGKPGEGGDGEFEMVIGHAALEAIHLVYRSGSGQDLEAELAKLEFTDDGTGMLDLGLAGSLDGDPIELTGRLGTFIGLINTNRVEHDLVGRFADAEFSLRGSIEDLSSLSGVNNDVSIGGPDPGQITRPFGLDPVVEGPFSVAASVRPSTAGSDVSLDASLGEMTGKAVGTVDSIVDPGALDVTVSASGPDVTAIGSIAGIDDLPAKPFAVSGRVQWSGFPLICDNVEVRVGENALSADGVLGKPPLMLGTDFTFEGGGPNIAPIAALAGINLPRDGFSVSGRIIRQDEAINVEGIEARVGQTNLKVNGIVGDPPEYAGTALSFEGSGANLAHFRDLANVALPAESFEVTGKLVQGDRAIELEAVRARLGSHRFRVKGQLSTEAGFSGTDLQLNAKGPDASQLAAIAELSDVPAEPYSIDGRVRVLEKGYRVTRVAGSLGSLAVKVDGFVAPPPTLVGSDLQIHVEDSDLSHPASIAGIEGLPHDAFIIDTRLRIEDRGYRIDDFEATVSDMELEANGLVGEAGDLEGTQLHIDARGPKLSSLDQYLDIELPPAPFSVTGNVRITDGTYVMGDVVAEIDGNTAIFNGTVQPVENLVGTELDLEFSGPELEGLRQLAVGFVDLPALPSEPFTLEAGLHIDEQGCRINSLRATLAEAVAEIDGRLGPPPRFFGTDLTIDSDGPNASLVMSLAGIEVPIAPFQLSGRIGRDDMGFQFSDVTVRVGEYRASLDGTLGALPKLIGTDFRIHASGPGTGLIRELSGLTWLPDRPFTLDGDFRGTPEQFSTRQFDLTFGPSDFEGSFAVDITGKPDVQARLTSSVIDLSRLRERLEEDEQDPAGEAVAEPPPADSNALVIPDETFNLEWLNAADADVTIRADTLIMPAAILRNFKFDFDLERGRLEIHRLAAVGEGGGRVDGSFVLEPTEFGFHMHTDLSIGQIRLAIPGSTIDRMEQPPIDFDIDLESFGATPHELASSANGAIQLVIGQGVMDSRALDLITTDILLTLLSAFNPFAKQDESTVLQCGVALLTVDDGVARLEPMAFQSDKMTLLGHGNVDFRTEKLNLEWITKPRKGIGLSASMITNPYIRLGGTLSAPSMQLKEAEAVVSTGAAVATMGLSLVAKGMYDRVTAEKKVCKKALKEIGRRADGSTEKSKKKK